MKISREWLLTVLSIVMLFIATHHSNALFSMILGAIAFIILFATWWAVLFIKVCK